ncbi:hypothetical protein [Cytobacillus luteolus]|uniref:hypothetical protein n=1 Tax=Litchfieldia luteola TaxID=682179 RepID=UPI001AE4AFF8|nr:hypothetical protein [Cytobacillus luteolus]MBP1944631.1 hypothetical protein [Cytobacillus luteolus]
MKRRRKKGKYQNMSNLFKLYVAFQSTTDTNDKLTIAFEMMNYDLDTIIKHGEHYQKFFIDVVLFAVKQGKDCWLQRGYSEQLFQDALESTTELIR